MDLQALLFNPLYTVLAVDTTLIVNATEYPIRAIDKTSGIDTGDAVHGQSILPAAVVKAKDVLALGFRLTDLGSKKTFLKLNGIWFNVVTYRLRPSPYGENDGEVYLILNKIPVVEPVLLPPGVFADEGILNEPVVLTTDLGVTLDPPVLDDAVLDAILTIVFELSAAISDDLGLDAADTIIDPDDMSAALADDGGLGANLGLFTLLSADIADDTGLAASFVVTTELLSSLADDTGLDGILSTIVLLSATIADDTGLTPMPILSLALSATIADDTGLTGSLTFVDLLTAGIADDTGLAASITLINSLTVAFQEQLIGTQNNNLGQTFSSVAIGTASADRWVVVAVAVGDANATLSSLGLTINGSAATLAAQHTSDKFISGIFYANVPSGTTASIAYSATGGSQGGAILEVYTIKGTNALIVSSSGDLFNISAFASATRTLTNQSGGAIIAIGAAFPGSNFASTFTWGGTSAVVSNDNSHLTQSTAANSIDVGSALKSALTGSSVTVNFNYNGSSSTNRVYGTSVAFGG